MRVLYLGDDAFDYVSDPLYVGLSRILGNDAVVDYPYKPLYHDEQARNWFMVQRPGIRYDRTQILDQVRAGLFDLACIASFRAPCVAECRALFSQATFPPTVFIDGSDDAIIRHEIVQQFPVGVYFKRDYLWDPANAVGRIRALGGAFRWNRRLLDRTRTLPVSIIPEAIPRVGPLPKDIDVSYTGRVSHPRRVKAVEILSHLPGVRFEGGVYADAGDRKYKLKASAVARLWTKLTDDGPAPEEARNKKKPPPAYYAEIVRSKMALHIRGGGWTPSPRYYEIPFLGTLLISDKPEAVIPNDFESGRHAVFCRADLGDLAAIVRRYLHEPAEREAVIQAGADHVRRYHTCEKRAEYFLDICRRLL